MMSTVKDVSEFQFIGEMIFRMKLLSVYVTELIENFGSIGKVQCAYKNKRRFF